MLYLFNPFLGKMSRGHWWLMQFMIFALAFAAMFLTIMLVADANAPTGTRNMGENTSLMIIVAVIYMNFSTSLNRLRDSNRSGLWYLTFLLPMVGSGLMIYFCGVEAGKKSSIDPFSSRIFSK